MIASSTGSMVGTVERIGVVCGDHQEDTQSVDKNFLMGCVGFLMERDGGFDDASKDRVNKQFEAVLTPTLDVATVVAWLEKESST